MTENSAQRRRGVCVGAILSDHGGQVDENLRWLMNRNRRCFYLVTTNNITITIYRLRSQLTAVLKYKTSTRTGQRRSAKAYPGDIRSPDLEDNLNLMGTIYCSKIGYMCDKTAGGNNTITGL